MVLFMAVWWWLTLGKRHLARANAYALERKDINVKDVYVVDKSVKVHSKHKPLSDFDYYCPYDKLSCKRFDSVLDAGACFTYNVNGRLRFVCKRFVASAGYSIPKQLSPEDMAEAHP